MPTHNAGCADSWHCEVRMLLHPVVRAIPARPARFDFGLQVCNEMCATSLHGLDVMAATSLKACRPSRPACLPQVEGTQVAGCKNPGVAPTLYT